MSATPRHGVPVPRWSPGQGGLLAAVLALGLVLGWLGRAPGVSHGGDEATYIALSHSLEQGRYRDEYLVGTPPHTTYPPGNPAWLLAVRRVAGPDLDRARLANMLLLLAAALLVGDALRRLGHPGLGVGATAVLALNPALLRSGGTLLSEPPYILLTTAALWATVGADRNSRSRVWPAVAVLGALGSALTRTAGVASIAAVGLWALRRRRWRVVGILAGVGGLGLLGWYAYVSGAASPLGHSYLADVDSVSSWGAAAVARRAAQHVVEFGGSVLPYLLGLPGVVGTWVDNAAWVALLGPLLALGAWRLWQEWPAACAALGFAGVILLGWPWADWRLLEPLLGLLVAAALLGAAALAAWWGPVAARRLPAGLAVLLAASAASTTTGRNLPPAGCSRAVPHGLAGCAAEDDHGLVEGALLVRDSVPANGVVVTSEPAVVYHYSGRTAAPISVVAAGPPEALRTRLTRIGAAYVLLTPLRREERGPAASALRASCRWFRLVGRPGGQALLLRLAAAPGGSEVCDALSGFPGAGAPDT